MNSWYKITNLGGNEAEVWMYDEIGGWGITAEGLVSELSQLNVASITVRLNSPGGNVFDGLAIMNALRDHPAHITVKVDALAASIASVIAQAGNTVIMGNNSMMMIHNASGWAQGEAKDLEKMAALLRTTTENIADVYTQRAGGTKKQWMTAMEEETWYSGEEAVAAGLADEVAPLPTEREARQAAAKFDLSLYNKAPVIEPPDPTVFEQAAAIRTILDKANETEPEPVLWDPGLFATSIQAAVPQPVTWEPDLFRAAIDLVVNNSPVPPTITPPPDPVAGFDPHVFELAMRKARS